MNVGGILRRDVLSCEPKFLVDGSAEGLEMCLSGVDLVVGIRAAGIGLLFPASDGIAASSGVDTDRLPGSCGIQVYRALEF